MNLTFLPSLTPPDYPGLVDVIIDGGVPIVETAGRNPAEYLPALKEAGIKVIHKCTSVRHSLKAQSIGCDAVSVDGFECGGHPGEDDIPNFILLPRAADELEIPFVASGGMADARSLVAAMALGAEGMNMGTRFIATQEAPVHQNVKDAIVNASELDTRLIMRSLRNTERVVLRTRVSDTLSAFGDGNNRSSIYDWNTTGSFNNASLTPNSFDQLQLVRVRLEVTGPADQLVDNIRLTSTPPLPEDRLLALIGGNSLVGLVGGSAGAAVATVVGQSLLSPLVGSLTELLGQRLTFAIYPAYVLPTNYDAESNRSGQVPSQLVPVTDIGLDVSER